MKKKIMKFGGALMIAASLFTFTFSSNAAVVAGPSDCDTYCSYSTLFDCVLTYSDGSTYRCYYNRASVVIEEAPV